MFHNMFMWTTFRPTPYTQCGEFWRASAAPCAIYLQAPANQDEFSTSCNPRLRHADAKKEPMGNVHLEERRRDYKSKLDCEDGTYPASSHLRFSQRCLWDVNRHSLADNDVSEQPLTSIFRVADNVICDRIVLALHPSTFKEGHLSTVAALYICFSYKKEKLLVHMRV
jgi:hypothetical protein